MALGSNGGNYQSSGNGGNNNNQNSLYNPTYYSRIRIKNPVDNLSLNFTFWNGTLRIAISESGSAQEGRNNELAYIHLSPTKARLFSKCVGRIIDDPETLDIFGVDTGFGETRGLIAIARDMGKPYLVIAKVNSNGAYESNQRFNFNVDYNTLLQISDLARLSFKKEIDNTIELNQLKDLLDDYARFASGALGVSVHDVARYEAAKSSNLIRKIGIKVGAVDSNYGNGGNRSGNNSFFSSSENEYASPSSTSATSPNASKKSSSTYQSISNLEDDFD